MGACDFITYGFGKDADEAFSRCVQDAQWESGHGGYTGTIAEKGSFRMFSPPRTRLGAGALAECAIYGGDTVTEYRKLPPGEKPSGSYRGSYGPDGEMVYYVPVQKKLPPAVLEWVQRVHPKVQDKWGPAGCIEVTGKAAQEYRKRAGLKGRKGKVFVFFGLASS
jgi:hypothetical protein